jgi:drug/metabolite transporter (DMT)-like permease
MKPRDLVDLLALAALWGASFLFMRLGAGEFGAAPLAAVRVVGASLFLLPLLASRGQLGGLHRHWRPLLLVGLTNSALPFLCFAYAAQAISAGLSAIFNATTPLWGALIAWLWFKDKLTRWRIVGLALGFVGVTGLAWDQAGFKTGVAGTQVGLAVLACLAAPALYGFSGNFTRRHLAGVAPLVQATGSQLSATLFLTLPAALFWPAVNPGATAWAAVAALAVLCTGIAYILYFRLIAHLGAANAMAVTYLIPVFAVAWGAALLAEMPTSAMLVGAVVILAGTALATGLLPRRPV